MAESDIPDFPSTSPPVIERPAVGDAVQSVAAPRQWPTVVGVICLVLGLLGLLQGVCGLVGNLVAPLVLDMLPKGAAASSTGMAQQFQPYLLAIVAMALVLSSMLAASGIALTKRRQWARSVLLHWAWLRMLVVAASVVLNYFLMQEQVTNTVDQVSAGSPNAALPPWFDSLMSAIGTFSIAWGLVWGWALPVFCLIWFNRAGIRAEIRDWR